MKKYTNKLISETSPYLLQHANNPVNWYPWGSEALNKANEENKLLLISIGYSACHWCHVMETESFANEEIAKIMNEHFVCIKVDREERPDIDQIYMNAVQLIIGRGGWPLNCFAMPDGRPVYGGTYFNPQMWTDLLKNLSASYTSDPQRFEKAADDLKRNLNVVDHVVKVNEKSEFSFEDILNIILKLRKNFDKQYGGTIETPKFPLPVSYYPLMRYYYHSGDKDILNQLNRSLMQMAGGGIYDHIGGGFARYSVDKKWLVPHFEKMLYDNAQLISLYSEAYKINPDKEYKRIVEETISFILREMKSPEGGFYSSFDADSQGEEGKFYVWQKSEIDLLLKENSDIFCDYYDITEQGNWEGKNILNIKKTKKEICSEYKLTTENLDLILSESKQILFNEREKRIKPLLDDKILVSWNSLVIKALVDAYNVFDNELYLKQAKQSFKFIETNLITKNNQLYRTYAKGKRKIKAFLDDYALIIDALLSLYQATFNEHYINSAKALLTYVTNHFYDNTSAMFFYTSSHDKQLVTRPMAITDHVIASSNSVMAHNLFRLGYLFLEDRYIIEAKQMLSNMLSNLKENPDYYGNWFDLLIQFVYKPYEVCIVGGENVHEIRKEFAKCFIPNTIFAGGSNSSLPILKNRFVDENPIIYICKDNVCNKPVHKFRDAIKQIDNSD